MTITPAAAAADVSPAQPVKVSVAGGQLTQVTVTNPDGKRVGGALAADNASWTSNEPLGYDRTYSVNAVAVNSDGQQSTVQSSFTTVRPGNFTMPYIDNIANDGTYGVGMPIKVRFDEPITDKATAEKALVVQTTPPVEGAWSWLTDQAVTWRPKEYWPSGTKVNVSANVYGLKVGDGLYGQADVGRSFTIGDSHISKVSNAEKIVRVYTNGQLVREMPTSMGKGGIQVVNGTTISYTTNSGPHVVLEKENPVLMDSSTFGLPEDQGGYKELIPFAVKISVDGEYVHWADWSIWAQGNTNTSHGCLNVSPANAEFLYNYSLVGDIVDIEGTSQNLKPWNSGEWTVPWDQWKAGSALK